MRAQHQKRADEAAEHHRLGREEDEHADDGIGYRRLLRR